MYTLAITKLTDTKQTYRNLKSLKVYTVQATIHYIKYNSQAIFQMLLNQGVYNHQRFLSKETCKLFTTMKSSKSRRGLGFDKPDPNNAHYSPCASEAPACVFGHTGFSGTCAWADPQNDIVMVFLCNRIYPNPYSQKNLSRLNIRPRIQETIYKALQTP